MTGVTRGLRLVLATSAVTLTLGIAPVGASKPRIGELTPVQLSPGINTVRNFAGDGRDAMIAYAWRDNGNAHGYNLILVMLPTAQGKQDWNVVSVVSGGSAGPPQDVVSDDPHTFEDAVRSVRLAQGVVDGESGMLLVTSTRALPDSGSLPDPSIVTFEIYRLQRAANPTGETHDVFKRVSAWHSVSRYCNSEMALSKEFGFPLPGTYKGPSTPDGCD